MTVQNAPSTGSNPRIRSMLTITVTDDLDLSKYDPEDLVTARLQPPFLLDDDEEMQRLDLQRQRKAEQDLQDLLTPDQRERRAEHKKVRARVEFERYKKMVDNMGDPAEMQAKINEIVKKGPLADLAKKMFHSSQTPWTAEERPGQKIVRAGDLIQAKPKSNKTREALESLIELQRQQHDVLQTSATVMEEQLSELREANAKLQTQVDDANSRASKADESAASSKFWAITSALIAAAGIVVAIVIAVVANNSETPAEPVPSPTVEEGSK